MKIRNALVTLGILAALAAPAAADPTGYKCTTQDAVAQLGWIPSNLFIAWDQEAHRVIVSDPIILSFNDQLPVDGKMTVDNARRVSFSWQVKTKDSAGQKARILYMATIQKASGVLSLHAAPMGYANTFSALGKCEIGPVSG